MAVVDLNSATLVEIQSLPGITAEYARKIIASRPYRAMSDLEAAGIPHSIVEHVSPPAILRWTDASPGATPTHAAKEPKP